MTADPGTRAPRTQTHQQSTFLSSPGDIRFQLCELLGMYVTILSSQQPKWLQVKVISVEQAEMRGLKVIEVIWQRLACSADLT